MAKALELNTGHQPLLSTQAELFAAAIPPLEYGLVKRAFRTRRKTADRLLGSRILHGEAYMVNDIFRTQIGGGVGSDGHLHAMQMNPHPERHLTQDTHLQPFTPVRVEPSRQAEIVVIPRKRAPDWKRTLKSKGYVKFEPQRPVNLRLVEQDGKIGIEYKRRFRRTITAMLPDDGRPVIVAGTLSKLAQPSYYQDYPFKIDGIKRAAILRLPGLKGYQLAIKGLGDGSVALERLTQISSTMDVKMAPATKEIEAQPAPALAA